MDLREFLFKRLPYYYKENDTYKDGNDRGILERFLNVLGIEIQEEFVDQLEALINELDPTTATENYLQLLSFTVGSPTDIIGTTESLRERITQAISLYKIKGTVKSYQLLFNMLGYTVDVVELVPPNTIYDTGLLYDEDYQYDTDYCNLGCISYNLEYDEATTSGQMDPELEAAVIAAIKKDLEPLTAKLNQLTYMGE